LLVVFAHIALCGAVKVCQHGGDGANRGVETLQLKRGDGDPAVAWGARSREREETGAGGLSSKPPFPPLQPHRPRSIACCRLPQRRSCFRWKPESEEVNRRWAFSIVPPYRPIKKRWKPSRGHVCSRNFWKERNLTRKRRRNHYSLRPILLFSNIDVSRHILVVDTSVFVKSNMGRRE
jgi:hypothetical protein